METKVVVVGADGSRFTIAGEKAGDKGVYLLPDLGGFLDPAVKVVSQSPANLPGGRYVSHRTEIRRVTFAVDILNDAEVGSQSWAYRDSQWRKVWGYDKPTRIEVTTRGSGTRTLTAYLEEIDVDNKIDPHIQPINRVVMTVVAYDPFWWGEEEVFNIEAAPGVSTEFGVEVANPTDQDIWPIYALEGGVMWHVPDFSFKNDEFVNRTITIPDLAEDEHIVINTHPMARQIVAANGAPTWQRMNGVRFRHPIPPYTEEAPLFVHNNGFTPKSAQLRLQRPYSRPWGLE